MQLDIAKLTVFWISEDLNLRLHGNLAIDKFSTQATVYPCKPKQ